MHIEFYTVIVSYAMTAALGLLLIPILEKLKFGQTVRDDGPQRHLKKMGTPTMGGIIFIPAIALTTLLFTGFSFDTFVAIISMIGFGLIGFADDFIKITKKRSLGLRANQKLLFQLIFSIVLVLYVFINYSRPTEILLPFYPKMINLGLFYIPITIIFVIIGTVNSVNLTDGLDGLVSGIVAIVSFFYTVFLIINDYPDLAIFSAAITGACLGFLLFNHYPAKVFMGDTGSLGLGGAIASIAVLSRSHFYLAVFGIIFVIETLSVILQVVFFKITGKRIFKMSPIHHHFELCGWSERKVVHTFWLITLIMGIIAFMIYKG
ncbi:phospho-N-acetylmuramoyl-pentapeptide transferase [Tepidanaerobacter acetatoxydans Re1]|uniref:Phospho-N-acetylmuramoyl-pentapeptide-transferase n=2 Tax=Tepidanaerobacter acetatoxydans TaxID=499229 RepID=F4LT14_TEPAE|nr:phospho-N-acetylmuramoyl-pentapeptide-transferase [Tepidanaerobacter acetatoxydans]AEE91283.1 Phospho-N-acetylmuramoyl-pentapeptide-transferase [Tepidanaerobacter acetatoxydans Re1]CDI40622.1 phospho-N-acetylmuramoyl-pentapeptide transferase [Tepidanaerobacter acetatoxydans Re1]